MTDLQQNLSTSANCSEQTLDAVIVGAGFSGLYMLHRLRQLGYSAKIFETANDVGGTWFWNRYPGARCDVESMQYSYSFSDELQQEWHWSERYASQPEILRYLQHVADRFDLRKYIQFETRVIAAIFDENLLQWNIQTNRGDHVSAKFCIMATGCLSMAKHPDIKGVENFKGDVYHTGQWPHKDVNFKNLRIAVVGTGSSGIQCIPIIAEQAARLYVFQRTPNFSIPAHNAPLDANDEQLWKANYAEHRRRAAEGFFGVTFDGMVKNDSALNTTPKELQQIYESRWEIGGLTFMLAFNDLIVNKEANDTVKEFIHSKIRATVKDPTVAETLMAQYPVGTKRLCVDTNYYETFNRDNVTLVDLRTENIEEITSNGIKTKNATYEVDSIVFATGFEPMTGALLKIDIRGRSGLTIKKKWAEEPRTYLGLMTAGFPNLFMITGPGSPSVLSNMALSIERHVKWIAECIDYLHQNNIVSIEATSQAENEWMNHVNEIANHTLFPTVNSWYVGANIPGKPRVFMPYAGGIISYKQKCDQVAANGYEGCHLTMHQSPSSDVDGLIQLLDIVTTSRI